MNDKNQKNKKSVEELIEKMYSEKDEDLSLYGNKNLYQIYKNDFKDIRQKFKNSIVKEFL
jgi:hypothetical protein